MRKLKNEELNRISIEEYKQGGKTPIIVVLDNVRSLNNIGSVFRTADGLGIEAIYLCGITATPPNKDIYKTALGATDSVDWVYFETTLEAIEMLKQNNYQVFAVEQAEGAIMLNDFKPEKLQKYALVFGHEVHGVDQAVVDACSHCIEIPQVGTKHSFNISVSAGMVLWDFFSKLKLA